jgi:putative ABC transport system permease protein
VGAGNQVPMKGGSGCSAVFVEDRPLPPDGEPPCVGTARVAPGFFATLGVPLRGTEPSWTDHESLSGGVVVSRALADRLWPGEDPLGKGIRGNGWAQPFYRVVGVTGELRGQGLDKPATEAVYFPMLPMEGAPLWSAPRSLTVVARTRTERPEALAGAIRTTLHGMDPTIPIANIQTMEQIIARSESVARVTFTLLLLGIGAGMALLLSTVGLYGVLSYIVSQRWGEIGIRMALGAQAGDVLRLVVRRGLVLAIAGAALGLVGAFAVTRVLSGMLFGVSPTDPAAFGAVTLVLVLVALVASYLPARRATRVDPMIALRAE